jgi:hypothetical protein
LQQAGWRDRTVDKDARKTVAAEVGHGLGASSDGTEINCSPAGPKNRHDRPFPQKPNGFQDNPRLPGDFNALYFMNMHSTGGGVKPIPCVIMPALIDENGLDACKIGDVAYACGRVIRLISLISESKSQSSDDNRTSRLDEDFAFRCQIN